MINLDRHTEKLKMAFASLVCDLEKHLSRQNERANVLLYLKLIDKNLHEKVRDYESISDIISELSEHISFFDYAIIRRFIREFGSANNKRKLKKYRGMFREYSKRRVIECPNDAFGVVDKAEKVWVIKTDKNFETLTVNDVKMLQCEMNKELGSVNKPMRLLSVEEGCVQLIFRGFGEEKFIITDKQQQNLRNLGVLSIRYGDQLMNISGKESGISETNYGEMLYF